MPLIQLAIKIRGPNINSALIRPDCKKLGTVTLCTISRNKYSYGTSLLLQKVHLPFRYVRVTVQHWFYVVTYQMPIVLLSIVFTKILRLVLFMFSSEHFKTLPWANVLRKWNCRLKRLEVFEIYHHKYFEMKSRCVNCLHNVLFTSLMSLE